MKRMLIVTIAAIGALLMAAGENASAACETKWNEEAGFFMCKTSPEAENVYEWQRIEYGSHSARLMLIGDAVQSKKLMLCIADIDGSLSEFCEVVDRVCRDKMQSDLTFPVTIKMADGTALLGSCDCWVDLSPGNGLAGLEVSNVFICLDYSAMHYKKEPRGSQEEHDAYIGAVWSGFDIEMVDVADGLLVVTMSPMRTGELIKQLESSIVACVEDMRYYNEFATRQSLPDAGPTGNELLARVYLNLADITRREQQDIAKSREWCRRAAETGNVEAMRAYGESLTCGEVPYDESPDGELWLKKAIALGDRPSLKRLATHYYIKAIDLGYTQPGYDTSVDYAKAAYWLHRCAKLDSRDAWTHYALSRLYNQGHGVSPNDETAFSHAAIATELEDNKLYLTNLAAYYLNGWGVERSIDMVKELCAIVLNSESSDANAKSEARELLDAIGK